MKMKTCPKCNEEKLVTLSRYRMTVGTLLIGISMLTFWIPPVAVILFIVGMVSMLISAFALIADKGKHKCLSCKAEFDNIN